MQCIQCSCTAYKQAPGNHFVSHCVRILGFDQGRADNSECHAPFLNHLTVMGPLFSAGGEKPPLSQSNEEPLLSSPSTEPQDPLPSTQRQLSPEKFAPSGQQAFDVGDILSGKVPKAGLPDAMMYNFLQNHYRDKKPETLTFQLSRFHLYSSLVYSQSMPGGLCVFIKTKS